MIMEDYFLIGVFTIPVIIGMIASAMSIINDLKHNHIREN